MTGAAFAAFGAVIGALVTALASVMISFYQHRSALQHEHRVRAFEQRLDQYEKIFITARSTQDALRDYVAVDKRVSDRSDPFLRQLLALVTHWAQEYCLAVDWHHNAGIIYLDIKLEQKCLHLRDLLLRWMSKQRVTPGDIAFIRKNEVLSPIPLGRVKTLRPGDYEELRIERRMLMIPDPGDPKLITDIHRAVSSLVVDLKAVMSY